MQSIDQQQSCKVDYLAYLYSKWKNDFRDVFSNSMWSEGSDARHNVILGKFFLMKPEIEMYS